MIRLPIAAGLLALVLGGGCATGYTAKGAEKGARERPKQVLVLVEGLVFHPIPEAKQLALVRKECIDFGTAIASGMCERLEAQGVDAVNVVLAGVQKHDFPMLMAEELEADSAVPAELPILAPSKWNDGAEKAAALSSLFRTMDAYGWSAMAFGAPRDVDPPNGVKEKDLAFSPSDFETLFGRSMTSVVVLVEGGAFARRKVSAWKAVGVGVLVGVTSALLSGGSMVAVPSYGYGNQYPWFIKAVAVDTATGEVLWADTWFSKNPYAIDGYHENQASCASHLIRRCPLLDSK